MTGKSLHPVRLGAWLCLLGFSMLLMGCGTDVVPYLPETTVANLPSEDLAGPCTYAIRLAQGPVLVQGQPPQQIPQTSVLVVFERADSLTLFDDKTLIAQAQSLHMAMMYAYQCDAASFDDLQPLASAGPGRALFQALNQFSVSLAHPELASANVFLTGFSAAGYLAVTTANAYPSRVLGIVPYAPASAYDDLDGVAVSAAAAQIPTLILVSATDTQAGDHRPFSLFLRGWAQGGPWGFGSQPSLGHCCVDSIQPLLTPWVTTVFANDTNTEANGLVARKAIATPVQANVAFQIDVDSSFDPFGWQDFTLSDPNVTPSAGLGDPFQAWLPDAAVANAWLTWVTNSNGN